MGLSEIIIVAGAASLLVFIIPRMLLKKKRVRDFVKESFWLHPNMLTTYGLLLALLAIYLFFCEKSYSWGIFLMATGITLDAVDGHVARTCGNGTESGKFLDAFVDKLKYLAALGLFARLKILWPDGVIALASIELVFGQFLARLVAKKAGASIAARLVGKIKAIAIDILVLILMLSYAYNFNIQAFADYMLVICIILAVMSVFAKLPSFQGQKA